MNRKLVTADARDEPIIPARQSADEEIKKASVRKLIERYFYQLLEGCGNKNCENSNCKSSGLITQLTPNQAAAKALQLFAQDARLCITDQNPAKTLKANTGKEERPKQAIDVESPVSISSSSHTTSSTSKSSSSSSINSLSNAGSKSEAEFR